VTLAVVFGFAVHDGLAPVVGAAPYDVIGRQLPRQLVQLLNAGGDRGARFFPFLGNSGGVRRFLHLRDLLPVATLASLHKNLDVGCLVDGELSEDRVFVRIHDAATQRLLREFDLPFHAERPFDALPRIQFELMEVVGWEGRPHQPPALAGEAMAWYVIAKDELLSLEADIAVPPDIDPVRAARSCLEMIEDVALVQDVAIETAAQMLRIGKRNEDAAQLLRLVADRMAPAFDGYRRTAALQQLAGDEPGAAVTWTRAARLQPQSAEAVETAASLWFRTGHLDDALQVLMLARHAGTLTASGLGQLAAVADRLGDRALRDAVTGELMQRDRLPVPVARLLTSFLLEDDRAQEAEAIATRALEHQQQDAGLWLEHGRACLLLGSTERAGASLRRAIAQGLAGEARNDADRLLRMSSVPGLFAAMRQVDASLAGGDQRQALRTARNLVRVAADAGEAWLFLAIVRLRLGHDWRAERALRRALELDDGIAEAHNRLGILLVGQGNLEPGVQHLLRAGLLAPTDPSPRLHLAQAYAMLGRRGDGERSLREAERLGANPRALAAIKQQFYAQGA
jgi:Tfp pilus assembly protein PilF